MPSTLAEKWNCNNKLDYLVCICGQHNRLAVHHTHPPWQRRRRHNRKIIAVIIFVFGSLRATQTGLWLCHSRQHFQAHKWWWWMVGAETHLKNVVIFSGAHLFNCVRIAAERQLPRRSSSEKLVRSRVVQPCIEMAQFRRSSCGVILAGKEAPSEFSNVQARRRDS